MAELVTKDILFQGMKELEQIDAIFKIMGTPTEKDWPGFSKLPGVSHVSPTETVSLKELTAQLLVRQTLLGIN